MVIAAGCGRGANRRERRDGGRRREIRERRERESALLSFKGPTPRRRAEPDWISTAPPTAAALMPASTPGAAG
jgi:hypothetical protein